jgi:glycosyltransferase involved in cell wall biosynthesis
MLGCGAGGEAVLIKVIHVISDTNIGGAGKILLTFLENYDRGRFDIEVLLPKGSLLAEPVRRLGVTGTEVDALADRSFHPRDVGRLLALFREKKPAVVHTHAALSARVAARLYGRCAVVFTRHSVFDQPEYKKRFPLRQANGFLNNSLSDVIIAVSPAAKENITETGTDPQKVRVVYNGIDNQRILSLAEKQSVRRELGLLEGDFVCAIIARLEAVKGHAYVLEAARILKEKDPGIKFVIAGGGSLEAQLKEAAADLSNVIFTGFLSDIYKIENICDLQLNASWGTEATSLSLLEGMSLGIPAVVSNFGGNPYVIENGVSGLVIPKKDASALAEAIGKLKEDRETYERMAAGAKRIFCEKFTARAMTRAIEEIYVQAVQQSEGGKWRKK